MDINLLVKLTSRAWALDILAALIQGTPGRQAPLLAATGAGRTAFAQSLTHLIDLELLERNPGHGHPLRPEFCLTPNGVNAADLAARILSATPSASAFALIKKRWTVPVLAQAHQPQPFTGFSRRLPVTDRALSQTLKALTSADWLAREVQTQMSPPRPFYRAINEGADIGKMARTFRQ